MLTLPLFFAGALSPGARAQDSHYWNLSYGTQATLLGGTVIGSASDLSATYYNPGMLAVNREQGLLLGANVYMYRVVSIEGGREGKSTSSQLSPAPGLVAGRIPVDSAAIGGVAYSILSRQYYSADLQRRIVGPSDFIGGDGIPEQVANELAFSTKLSETWVGATLFRLIGPGLGVGLTNYVALRNQSLRSSRVTGVLTGSGSLTASSRIVDVEYSHVRLLWKLGVGADLGRLTLGATVTTPSLGLFGSGSDYLALVYSGVASTTDTTHKEVLAATNQPDLDASFRSSWAVGVGAGYRLGDARLHFSAEWYAPVERFDVLPTSPFRGQTDGNLYESPVAFQMRSVLNVGIGLEYDLSGSASIYGSLISDATGLTSESGNTLAVTAWDLFHISAGALLRFAPFDLTVGLSYAAGSEQLGDIPWTRASSSVTTIGAFPDDATVRSATLTGILAFTFRL